MKFSFKAEAGNLAAGLRDLLKSRACQEWRLGGLGVNRVFWGERGTGSYLLIKKLNRLYPIENSRILLEGIQGGREMENFLPYQPKLIAGCELFNYREDWERLKKNTGCCPGRVYILQNDVQNLCFAGGAFDIIGSFAVYEHIKNVEMAMAESKRCLKKDGVLFMTLGSLYYCFGGDHFSGHGGIENGYNHLILAKREYVEYFDRYSYQLGTEKGGYRKFIVEEPLFSYLKFGYYLELFKKYFAIDYLAVKISSEALCFEKRFPEKFKRLQDENNLSPQDLIIKGIIAYLRKAD